MPPGGSTIILLFEPGVMRFDDDLIDNSKSAIETLIMAGMSVGHSPHVASHRPVRKQESQLTEEDFQQAKRRISGSMAPSSGGLTAAFGSLTGGGMGAKNMM